MNCLCQCYIFSGLIIIFCNALAQLNFKCYYHIIILAKPIVPNNALMYK